MLLEHCWQRLQTPQLISDLLLVTWKAVFPSKKELFPGTRKGRHYLLKWHCQEWHIYPSESPVWGDFFHVMLFLQGSPNIRQKMPSQNAGHTMHNDSSFKSKPLPLIPRVWENKKCWILKAERKNWAKSCLLFHIGKVTCNFLSTVKIAISIFIINTIFSLTQLKESFSWIRLGPYCQWQSIQPVSEAQVRKQKCLSTTGHAIFFSSPWFRSCWLLLNLRRATQAPFSAPLRRQSLFHCSRRLNKKTSLERLDSPHLAWEGWWQWRPLINEGLPRVWCWQMPVMRSQKRQQHQMTWSVSLCPGHVSNPEPCNALDLCWQHEIHMACDDIWQSWNSVP